MSANSTRLQYTHDITVRQLKLDLTESPFAYIKNKHTGVAMAAALWLQFREQFALQQWKRVWQSKIALTTDWFSNFQRTFYRSSRFP